MMFTRFTHRRDLVRVLPSDGPAARLGFAREWPADRALSARAGTLASQADEASIDLRFVGTMPLFRGHVVARGRERDWVLVNLAEDPLLAHRSGFPIPRKELQYLKRVAEAGLRIDAVYIAHEVRRGAVTPSQPLTEDVLRPPPPRMVQELTRNLGTMAERIWRLGRVPMEFGFAVSRVGVVAAGLAATASALPMALANVDLIVFGVIVADGNAVCEGVEAAWFYVTHWDFGEEQ